MTEYNHPFYKYKHEIWEHRWGTRLPVIRINHKHDNQILTQTVSNYHRFSIHFLRTGCLVSSCDNNALSYCMTG